MKKLLCGFLLLVSALAYSTLGGAASITLDQAGAGGVSAIITPDPGEIGQPCKIWMGGVLNGTLYLRNGPSTWVQYAGGPLPVAQTCATLPSSLQVSIVDFDISSLIGLDVYVGYGSTEADLSLSGHLAKVYTTVPVPTDPLIPTGPYAVKQTVTLGGETLSGFVCKITTPFAVFVATPRVSFVFNFSPNLAARGTFTYAYSIPSAGESHNASGTYKIGLPAPDGTLVLSMTGSDHVKFTGFEGNFPVNYQFSLVPSNDGPCAPLP
jgi:hypothetical protein